MKTKNAFLYGPGDLRITEVDVPALKPSQILVKVHASGICGSDVECYLGHSKEGRYDLGPYTPGHEWCGEVVDVGRDVITFKKGDKVTGECANPCNRCETCKEGINTSYCPNWNEVGFMPTAPGGMGQYLVGEEQFCHRVPDEMSYLEGALVEPCSIAYYSIFGRDGHVANTDDCVVFGAGPIGLFAASICKIAGARVTLVEPVEFRRKLAQDVIGVDAVVDPIRENVVEVIMRETGGQGASLVVECTGSDAGTSATVQIAKAHGRIRFIGHSIGRSIPMEIGRVIWKGLNLQGSAGQPWFFPQTIRFMTRARRHIDFAKFITHQYEFSRLQDAFDLAVKHKDKAVKVMITMD